MKKARLILSGVVCVGLLGWALAMDMSASVDEMEVKNVEALASTVVEGKCDATNHEDCVIKMGGAVLEGKGAGSLKEVPSAEPSK